MEFVVIGLFWILLGTAYVNGGKYLLYIFFSSMPFGAFAVIPPALTAGLTFTATPSSPLHWRHDIGNRNGAAYLLTSATDFRKLGLVSLFYAIALVVTFFRRDFSQTMSTSYLSEACWTTQTYCVPQHRTSRRSLTLGYQC